MTNPPAPANPVASGTGVIPLVLARLAEDAISMRFERGAYM